AEEWILAFPGLKQEWNGKIALADLAPFIDASEIKIFQNQLLSRRQLQYLLKHFNEIQLQHANADIRNTQAKRRAVEEKTNNSFRKERDAENRTELLLFNHLKEAVPGIKKMFAEEKLKLDSIRKVSVVLAEKQKEIW